MEVFGTHVNVFRLGLSFMLAGVVGGIDRRNRQHKQRQEETTDN